MAGEKDGKYEQQNMDNPEQFKTDKESIYDKFKEEQNVDTIPLEDLKQEQHEEKMGRNTKDNSSSEEKYNADFETINKDKIGGDSYD
ncbi:hypothetical protein ACQCVH_04225 [Bacillus infantis]|jgi:hypothetical protein|uniref:hypothetical protein n=1 Tax=Bacillus infantis TaxID=324767 RepID=UPI003CF1DF67